MKKIFVTLFMFLSIYAYTQDADTSDFFRVGLYGGSYINEHSGLVEKNKYFNSIALEIEYMKLRNLSFYVRGIYENVERYVYDGNYQYLNVPIVYRLSTSFGAKYYLKEKNIRPYFQLGLNQETDYISSYTFYYYENGEKKTYTQRENWDYYYSLYIGVGCDIKLYKKFSADIHYDLYRILEGKYSRYDTFSILAGIKYNIVY